MNRATAARGVLLLSMTFALIQPSLSARAGSLAIDTEGNLTVQGWEGEAQVYAASPRTLWLSLASKDLSPSDVSFRAEGLQKGDYYLSVSGAEPRLLSAEELAQERTLHLPAVVGASAADLLELVKAWESRLDRVAEVVHDHGYREETIPGEYRQAMQDIRDTGEGLEEAALWRAVVVRVSPIEAGPMPLAAPSGIDSASLEARRETLSKNKKRLINGAGSLQGTLRKDLLEALIPIEVGGFSGRAVSLAARGEGGEGNFAFNLTNPLGNDSVEVVATLPVPQGWTIQGATTETLTLEPGQSHQVSRNAQVKVQEKETRVGFPVGLDVQIEKIRYQTVAGLGFGHDFIRDWSVVGPFENIHGNAVDRQDPPETEFDPKAHYAVMGEATATWKVAAARENGYLDLKTFFEPNTDCAAFASVFVFSPEEQSVQCAAGSNDGMKAFMNGAEIFSYPGERGAQPEQDLFPAHLNKGWNHLLVKSFNSGGEWGIYFEIRNRTGGPLAGGRFSTEPQD